MRATVPLKRLPLVSILWVQGVRRASWIKGILARRGPRSRESAGREPPAQEAPKAERVCPMRLPPLPEDLRVRLDALAKRAGKSTEDCVAQAIAEYVENWEAYHRAVDALREDEPRPILTEAPL
ncbi:hypothetical protein CKO38_12900 [Rhodospirillum rubrum]|nr:hypothetical protein [Rhodospirillum rubrum]MBK1677548.1 hypothetical protein [Rhodospirillum rubrum]